MARKPKTNVNINGYDYAKTSLTIGKDEKGNPIKKIFYGANKGEANKKKEKYKEDIKTGINPDLATQSLSQAMYTWLWDIEKHSGNKSSSFERYEGIYRNYIKDTDIGILNISEIKKVAIQKYYNKLEKDNKTYSQIKNLHKLLNKFFGYAETEGYVVKNSCKGIKISKEDENDISYEDIIIETFTKDEIKLLTTCLGHEKLRYVVMFALLTGLREGELLALEKTDIKNKSIVKVNKTLRTVKVYDNDDKHHYELKVTKPKTKNSNREVPIPDILNTELKNLNKLIAEEKLKFGPAYEENNLLFPSLTGTYIDAKNLRRSWERALKNAGIQYKKFHALRHTYATRLFENGASILTVSRLLGHGSVKTTEIYTHVLEDIKAAEVQCLNDMFI